MLIRCWGARGSIPVSGREYERYGGDTPCVEIRTKDDHIVIIDAGSGIRRLGNRLLAENRHDYTMIFTHTHWDHIMGFPFFKPIYLTDTRISLVRLPLRPGLRPGDDLPHHGPPQFPREFRRHHGGHPLSGNLSGNLSTRRPDHHPHSDQPPQPGDGIPFRRGGKSFVFLTDNELTYRHPGGLEYEDYRAFAKGADLLVHDAEYLPGIIV